MATKSQLPVVTTPPATQVPAHLLESTHRYIASGLRGAANTVRAYAGDWKRFTAWCSLHEMAALPASVEALVGFLTELADTGKKFATIERHVAAIAKAHELAGTESPTTDKSSRCCSRVLPARSKPAKSRRPPFRWTPSSAPSRVSM